jgi:O-antigen biosynthesis protein
MTNISPRKPASELSNQYAPGVVNKQSDETRNEPTEGFLRRCGRFLNGRFARSAWWRDGYEGTKALFRIVCSQPQRTPQRIYKALRILRTQGMGEFRRRIWNKVVAGGLENEYPLWIQQYGTLSDSDRMAIKQDIDRLIYRPLISLIMPTYNSREKWLRLAIESVRRQLYSNWELCIADDASTESHARELLEEFRAIDARIKVVFRKDNGHISAASNTAIEMATGEYLAFLDHDDELSEHALYMVVAELNLHPDAELIYSDEDKLDEQGRRYDPYFKPDWNPALFLTQNFLCHLVVYRRRIVEDVGGFREGYEGSQDWDLAMRVSERISDKQIRHIPHVLYHWRAIAGSTAFGTEQKKYVIEAQRLTLTSHFDRLRRSTAILPTADAHWRVQYSLPAMPLVTLIIPTRNGRELLQRCLDSIHQTSTYRPFEIIVVDNQSDDPAALRYLAELEKHGGVRILRYDAPFNYAAINNFAVEHAAGQIIGFLNNDVEVITSNWLEEMVSHAVQPEIGAVGAMLYYPDNTIQHAGVILGLGGNPGVAGHPYQRQPLGRPVQALRGRLCQNFSALTAACLVVRRQVFEEVGGFDETNLAIAFNDVDLCLRFVERGYRNLWTPHAELYHFESASRGYEDTSEKQTRFKKECDYMHRRWGKLLANDPAYNPNLALDRDGFFLAFPPRVVKPWLLGSSSEGLACEVK